MILMMMVVLKHHAHLGPPCEQLQVLTMGSKPVGGSLPSLREHAGAEKGGVGMRMQTFVHTQGVQVGTTKKQRCVAGRM